jgi:hypothetical protein
MCTHTEHVQYTYAYISRVWGASCVSLFAATRRFGQAVHSGSTLLCQVTLTGGCFDLRCASGCFASVTKDRFRRMGDRYGSVLVVDVPGAAGQSAD